jgi:hypothetical protein
MRRISTHANNSVPIFSDFICGGQLFPGSGHAHHILRPGCGGFFLYQLSNPFAFGYAVFSTMPNIFIAYFELFWGLSS